MGQRDEQPDLGMEMTEGDAQQSLKGITEELEQLKHRLVQQLSQEIEQLQERKTKLMVETEALDQQREAQLAQQQELAQQLAPAIAEQLLDYIQANAIAPEPTGQPSLGNGSLKEYNDNANRLISSLDSTLRTTFRTLQQDVSSYQSTLSQQLGQMYSLEQQAQVILEALVSRIRSELQTDGRGSAFVAPIRPPQTYDQGQPVLPEHAPELPPIQEVRPPQRQPIARPAQAKPTTKPEKKKVSVSQIQLGFILVLASSLLLSFQNVVISIILNVSSLFGFWETGGYISPSFGNSLLILFLRMLVVVPLMAVLAQFLYPSSWQEIGRFLKSGDRVAFGYVIGCGFFLFASSALIYMALGALNPGVALTLFFVFPIVTVVCAWLFFGDRPSIVRWGATFTVFLGIVLIAFPKDGGGSLSALGVTTAIGAGVTFAFHVLLIQSCTKRLHPVPFSVINFGVILLFSLVSLLIPLPTTMQISVDPSQVWNLLASGAVLGGLTLLSYLTNNIGISHIGAARASIIGATGPALTSVMAWIIIGRPLTGLQLFGMLVVTAGVLGQNLERFFKKPAPKKS